MKRFLGCLLFLLTFLSGTLQAEPTPSLSGVSLSLSLEKKLTQSGFFPTRQNLSATAEDSFPFTILLELTGLSSQGETEGHRNRLYLLFTQEDAEKHIDSLCSFFKRIQSLSDSCTVTAVLTACDNVPVPLSQGIFGTRVFAEKLEDADKSSVVQITFGERNALYTNFSRTTPRKMAQALDKSFKDNKTVYFLPQWITSIYRLGLVRMHQSLEPVLTQGVPAAKVELESDENLTVIESFISHFDLSNTSNWESHYLMVHFPLMMRTLFVSEHFFVILTLVFGTLSLLFLYSFTFVGKDRIKQKREFRSTWYVIPLTYAISLAALFFTQGPPLSSALLKQTSPLFQTGLKIIASTLFVSIFFVFLQFLNKDVSTIVYGYIVLMLSVINIFIFSAVDLLFLIPMFIEYIIIYTTRKASSTFSLICVLSLMLIPFFPYLYILISEAKASSYLQFQYDSVRIAFLTALLLFPFQIIWLRLLRSIHTKLLATASFKKKVFANAISALSGIFILTSVIIILYISTIRGQVKEEADTFTFVENTTKNLSFKTTVTTFASLSTVHLSIHSEKEALCYTVRVHSQDTIPIIDSSYDYTSNESTRNTTFSIPPYPGKNCTIDFAVNEISGFTVSVSAVYPTDAQNIFERENHSFSIEELTASGEIESRSLPERGNL